MDPGPARRWWIRITIDITPLRTSRDYRLLWLGQVVSVTGSQIRMVAIPYQVYLITHSSLAVGLIGLFQAIPLLAFSLWGGVIADAVDRRKLLMITQALLAVVSVTLALGTHAGLASLPFLYGLSAVGAALSAIDTPARASMIPNLVGRAQIPAAIALNQVMFQTAQVAGPAFGGLAIARFGLTTSYLIDVASYAAALYAVFAMAPPQRTPGGARPGFKSLIEGLRYLKSNKILWSTMALDFIAMFFGWPRALFPYFADQVFHVGPQGLGLLYSAPAVGALVGALLGGWVSHVRRQGLAVLAAVAGWGLAIAAFGSIHAGLAVALVFLAAAGMADVFSAIFRGTLLQMMTPDHLRGRMTSVNLMVVVTGPRLGELESGLLAAAFSPAFAVVSGGLICVAAVVLSFFVVPSLARYTVSDEDTSI